MKGKGGKCVGKQLSVTHYAAGGMVRDAGKKYTYANERFDTPQDWSKKLPERRLPEDMRWPGYEDKPTPREAEEELGPLLPRTKRKTAPVELEPRARRKSQKT